MRRLTRHAHGMTSDDRSDRGAAMVEFAILAPLLVMLVIGMLEFGLLFKDSLTANSASREAARIIVAAGDHVSADQWGLDAAQATMQAAAVQIDTISIVNQAGNGSSYTPDGSGGWIASPINSGWPPASRQTDVANLDHAIVMVNYKHKWITNLFGSGERILTEETEMRLEPRRF